MLYKEGVSNTNTAAGFRRGGGHRSEGSHPVRRRRQGQAPRGPERDPPGGGGGGVGARRSRAARGGIFAVFGGLSEAERVLTRGFGEGGLCGRGLFSRAAAGGVVGLGSRSNAVCERSLPFFHSCCGYPVEDMRRAGGVDVPDHRESASAWERWGHAPSRAGWMGISGRGGGRKACGPRGVTGRPVLSGRGGAASLFPLLPAGRGTRGGRNGLPSPGGLGFRLGGASNRPPRSRFPSGIPAPRR